MLGPELRVVIYHHPRFPAAKILDLIEARTGLAVPRLPMYDGDRETGNP